MTEGRGQESGIRKQEKAVCDLIPALCVLKRRAEFLAVAQKGKKWVTPGLILQFYANPESEKAGCIRYGLTASAKTGNAVKRNRARRRLRSLAREVLPAHARAGHDYVLIARDATAARDYSALKNDLLLALKKLGTLRE